MFHPIFTKQFKKDYKLSQKRNLPIEDLDYVIEKLIDGKRLDFKYKDHALMGKYRDCRECHVYNDWLLLYRYDFTDSTVTFIRTGSHSDLF
jgi:mRNA interferase YafQ